MKKNQIGVGWDKMGDLATLTADREAFKSRFAERYPGGKVGAIPVSAGQMFRFVHEMVINDFVIYPSKVDKSIHIGRVEGPYQHQPKDEPSYPHRRAVKWLGTFPRTRFTQGALYEIGSALSFFQVKSYADEFRSVLEDGDQAMPVAEDETVGRVAEEIEQSTRDFILKRLSQELKGHPFETFVAHLLETMGFQARVSPEGPDGGIDVLASKDELALEPPIIKVQVKSQDGNVGEPAVSSLYGKVSENEFGLLVTLGGFTAQARTFETSKSNLRLVDGDQLVGLVLAHYDQFNSHYKGILPLKQVYIPEGIVDRVD